MSILKSLEELLNPPVPEEIIYTCEICGAQTKEGDTYSLAWHYRKPGRGIPAFQCPGEQHFACSHEHAVQAMMACLEEHGEPILEIIRNKVTALREQQAMIPSNIDKDNQ